MDAKAQDPSGEKQRLPKKPLRGFEPKWAPQKPRNYLRTWGLNRDEDDEYEHPHTRTTHKGDTQTTNDKNKKAHEAIQRANTNNKQRRNTTHAYYTRMLHGG